MDYAFDRLASDVVWTKGERGADSFWKRWKNAWFCKPVFFAFWRISWFWWFVLAWQLAKIGNMVQVCGSFFGPSI